MNIIGIIAEYNPFHVGHLYHLEEAKRRVPDSAIIAVMSGSFVQRGEPALVNKWSRAEMALAGGADVVLELPVLYSVRSAYWFARGAIETLQQTGVVTHLAFGAETDDPALLQKAANILAGETPAFQANLKHALKKGLSYPDARGQALECEDDLASSLNTFSKPNNILGITYLQVLQELAYPLIPIIIERKGAGYDDKSMESVIPSATAIRHHLLNTAKQKPHAQAPSSEDYLVALEEIKDLLPAPTYKILLKEFEKSQGPVSLDSLSVPIMALLRRSSKEYLNSIVDVTEGLENRIMKLAQECVNLNEFLGALKTKRYTYTRLRRFLIHLLLNYTSDLESMLPGGPPYLRLLGFSERGQQLIRLIKEKAAIPVITKGAHGKKYCCEDARYRTFWEKDILSGNLYTLLYPDESARIGNADFLISPVTITKNNFLV